MLLRARMRAEGRRNDVCIRNVSSQGMLLQCASPPPRGTFVDVTCGHQAIVARVVWTSEHRFGVKARSRINVEELVHGAMARAQPAQRKSDAGFAAVARAAASPAALDRNRQISAACQYALLGACAMAAAMVAASLIYDTLQSLVGQLSVLS